MKRIILFSVLAIAMTLTAPGVASAAHHGHGRNAARHARGHARKARRHRLVRFGDLTGPSAPGSGTPTGTSTTPGSTSPTSPTTPTGESAGKVLTFENGVLTIELTGGAKVSGQVTERTRLICIPATPPTPTGTGEDDQGGGDDQSGDQEGEHGGPPPWQSSTSSDGGWGGEDHAQAGGDEGDDQMDMNDEDDQPPSCETTALAPGATVRGAELSLTGSGAVWEWVAVIH